MGETALNPLDAAGLALVDALAGRSLGFDWAVNFVFTVPLAKFGVPVLLALYAWLDRPAAEPPLRRAQRVTFSFLGVMLAIGIGRAVQDFLPPRLRPRQALPWFEFPGPADLPDLSQWSSFPSDHAVLAAALATAVFVYSRWLGVLAAVWGVFIVAFPRLYFGYHFVTDLLAGAALGVAITSLVLWLRRPLALPDALLWVERRAPAVFAIFLFVVAYEYIELFQATRRLMGAVRDVLFALS